MQSPILSDDSTSTTKGSPTTVEAKQRSDLKNGVMNTYSDVLDHVSDVVDHVSMEIETRRLRPLRGPILVLFAVTLIVSPYLLRLPPRFVLKLTILGLGLLYCCYDLLPILELKTRRTLQGLFDAIVLDDVLKSIYDPDTGLIACIIGSFVGASTMYALRLDPEQRTKLVQSSLWVSNEEARTILHSPGGCKTLLPESMQTWLSQDAELQTTAKTTTSPLPDDDDGQDNDSRHDSDSSQSACKSTPEELKDRCIPKEAVATSRGLAFGTATASSDERKDDNSSDQHSESEDREVPQQYPPGGMGDDPATVMFEIVSEMICKKIKEQAVTMSQSISRTQVENVATAASVALATQLFLRRRSSTSLLGSVFAFVFSGTAVAAFSGFVAREVALGNIHDKESAQIILRAAAMRVLERIKSLAKEKLQFKRVLAMVVMALVGRSGSRRFKQPLQHPTDGQSH